MTTKQRERPVNPEQTCCGMPVEWDATQQSFAVASDRPNADLGVANLAAENLLLVSNPSRQGTNRPTIGQLQSSTVSALMIAVICEIADLT